MLTSYDHDLYAWTREQANFLKKNQLDRLDLDHLAEEIEDMGKNVKNQLISRLEVLLVHLLKWQFQPSMRSRSWELTIKEQRRRIEKHFEKNPSLKSEKNLQEAFETGYEFAILRGAAETGFSEKAFPKKCPYTSKQVFDEKFYPQD